MTASKTPIQVLHEYGIKCGSLPVYVLEKAEGEAHQPSFVFNVKFGDVSCTGEPQVTLCCVLRSAFPVWFVDLTDGQNLILSLIHRSGSQ